MEWTSDKPTESGQYWIYVSQWDGEMIVDCIGVAVNDGNISFDYLVGGYEWEGDYAEESVTHWMGPLEEPSKPTLLPEKKTELDDLVALRDALQEAYTPIIPLRQWMFGETPCSKMVADMIKEKRSKP